MNLPEIKTRLDNLVKYYEFLATAPESISTIDKDTFLMKLRELYDIAITTEKINGSAVVEIATQKEEPKVEEIPKEEKTAKKTTQFVFTKTEEPSTKKEEPKAEIKEEPKAVVEPIVEKVKETPPVLVEKKEEPKVVVEPVEEVKKEATVVETKKETAQPEEPATSTDTFNEDFAELFVYKQATDLAAKLSESPIANLSQVLGLNEKFYYINELFGGDAAKFNQAIDYLNGIGDFDKARLYIEENFVEQLGWMKKEKKSLAKDFVKLVRRRYLV